MGVVRDIAYMGDLSVYLLRLDSGKVARHPAEHFPPRGRPDHLGRACYLSWHASSPVVVTK